MPDSSILGPNAVTEPAASAQDATVAASFEPATAACDARPALSMAGPVCDVAQVIDAQAATDAHQAISAPLGPEESVMSAVRAVLGEAGGTDLAASANRSIEAIFSGSRGRWSRVGAALEQVLVPSSDPHGIPAPILQLSAVGDAVNELVRTEPLPFFVEGVVAGFSLGAADWLATTVKEQVAGIAGLLELGEALADVYAATLDASVWLLLLTALIDGRPDPATLAMIEEKHPQAWSLFERDVAFAEVLRGLVGRLHSDGPSGVVAGWINSLAHALGQAIRAVLQEIVDADGKPNDQGKIVGRLCAKVILDLVWLALGIATAVDGALLAFAKGGELLMAATGAEIVAAVATETEEVSAAVTVAVDEVGDASLAVGMSAAAKATVVPASESLRAALAGAERVASDIVSAGEAKAAAVQRELTKAWGDLSDISAPHRLTRQWTGKWNQAVRGATGLTTKDIEYAVKLRLDSAHIVDAQWFNNLAFRDEFMEIFTGWKVLDLEGNPVLVNGEELVVSWASSDDMDTIALLTEAHIRSGERMAEDLGLVGAGELHPLAVDMEAFFDEYLLRPDGTSGEFSSAAEIVRAHRTYYAKKQPILYRRLDGWFRRAEDACRAAGYDLPEWTPPPRVTTPPRG